MESRAVGALLMSYHLKGVFVGSGLEGMCKPAVVAEILRLTAKPDPQVVYLGTATYDSPVARETQTRPLIDAGAQVTPLDVAWDVDDAQKKDAETPEFRGWKRQWTARCVAFLTTMAAIPDSGPAASRARFSTCETGGPSVDLNR